MRWKTLSSRIAYENAWIRVREDRVVRPDGEEGIYGVVESPPSVFVVPLTAEDEVVMIEQVRYTTGRRSLEIPAGGSDGEDVLVAARRELAEETGLVAASWREVGAEIAQMNGIASELGWVYLASDLSPAGAHAQEAEGIDAVHRVPFSALTGMIARGEITDGQTITSLALAAIALGRWS